MKKQKTQITLDSSTEDLCPFDEDEGFTQDDILYGGIYLEPANTSPFSFTLRKASNAAKSTKKDYLYKLSKFKDMGITITNMVFENNHTNAGIHMHGTMSVPKKFNMKRFRTRGWHLSLKEIYDNFGWDMYMMKEQYLSASPTVGPVPEGLDADSVEVPPQIKIPKKRLF